MASGWTNSNRGARLPGNWKKLRRLVIARAGGRCEVLMRDGSRCRDRGVDVDHIDPGDNHELWNLQLICRWHHDRKTAREAAAGRRYYSAKRPREAHPGVK